jgi:long-subunit acyl-CoA synthetase (AMP-forming)
VTARLKPTDVAGGKLRLADFCTLTEALDYAAISRAGAGRTCRASERTICRTCKFSSGSTRSPTGVAVTQRVLLANVRGISRDALELTHGRVLEER